MSKLYITVAQRREQLLDETKDEIDRLHEIKSERKRREAANELIEYLQLHHGARP